MSRKARKMMRINEDRRWEEEYGEELRQRDETRTRKISRAEEVGGNE